MPNGSPLPTTSCPPEHPQPALLRSPSLAAGPAALSSPTQRPHWHPRFTRSPCSLAGTQPSCVKNGMEWMSEPELNALDAFARGIDGDGLVFLATVEGALALCRAYPRVSHELRAQRQAVKRLEQGLARTSRRRRSSAPRIR